MYVSVRAAERQCPGRRRYVHYYIYTQMTAEVIQVGSIAILINSFLSCRITGALSNEVS